MPKFQEIEPNKLIDKVAEELKKNSVIKAPEWALFAKTGANAARPPSDPEWWYARTAALLRKIAVRGPVGTEKLRTIYGSRKRRGHQPAEFRKTGGSAIRKALQQLQTAGFVKYKDKGIKKGRIVTPQGLSFLDRVAKTCKHDKQQQQKEE
ncbi:MAG: 30S ribosomal protein S19e [Nanoarchaeota archaeon]